LLNRGQRMTSLIDPNGRYGWWLSESV
jgi:hypothetical protein